ncbi:MAG: AMP-binding protein [Steroidobacteraceae bacterium]|jgi:2-aminobenzoate-CoA ligase|nr:AMP-binding protein [Steroidobacteraceae bacterium]
MATLTPDGHVSAHLDGFARERLPLRESWPALRFELPELHYPPRLNCATELLDRRIEAGEGARIVLRTDAGDWSYAQLQGTVDRIAHVLVQDLGVVPGNRVLLRAPNNPLLAAAWLAVIKAGAIAVTTMPMLRSHELQQVARKARIEHALCDARLAAELRDAARATGLLGRILTFGDGQLEAAMARHEAPFAAVDTAQDDVCLLAFTSGTTGEPKATMHFHRDVLAMADVVGRHLLDTGPDDVYAGSPPLGFTFGLGALLVFPLRFGASAVLLEQPTPESLLAAVQRHRVTCLFTAPTMYRNLLPLRARFDLGSLRRAVSAGEALPKATSDAWFEATGLRLIDGIGATEMIHIFISARPEDVRPGATGKPLPGYEACVLGPDDQPLPRGSSGRLAVRGPTGCRYLDDPRQADYVVGGWNVTGDRYRVDEDGYFWFEARADDMIVSAGYNIAGPEVEHALAAHPAVREVAVVGAPDRERGRIVKAFVVVSAGVQAGPALARELQDFVKARIAPYKYPRSVEFLDQLPKTQTGKVQRYVLRQRVEEQGAA